MIWRSTAMIVVAFVAAWAALWYGPLLLEPLGLGEFVFVGQLCFVVLALTVLERVYARIDTGPH